MKKFYALVIVSLFTISVFAQNVIETQNAYIQSKENVVINTSATKAIDTLLIYDFASLGGGYYRLGVTGATGWIFGTYVDNATGDEGCIQWGTGIPVMPTEQFNIIGTILWVHSKGGTASNSDMLVSINAIDDSSFYGTSTVSYEIACPGTELGSALVSWSALDTANAFGTVATYSTPIAINGTDFAVVWDVSDFYSNADSVGVIGADGFANLVAGDEYVWQLYSTAEASTGNDHSGDFWAQFSHIWNFTTIGNIAPAVFPIVDDNVGVENYFRGMKLGQNYPNPVIEGKTTINYAVENATDVTFTIWDMNGRTVYETNEGFKAAGEYTIVIDQELPAGSYVYSLTAGNERLTKMMIVQ